MMSASITQLLFSAAVLLATAGCFPMRMARAYKHLVRMYRKPKVSKYVKFLPAKTQLGGSDNAKSPSALLVFLPGYKKEPETYESLCQTIQRVAENSGMSLHIGIGKFCKNMPVYLGSEEINDIIDGVKLRAKETGSQFEKVFLCGHSAGSFAAFEQAHKYDGFIHLGCTWNSKGNLRWAGRSIHSFPRPTLTVVGERDGFVRPFALCDELDDLESLDMNESETSKYKPVIQLPGVNHMQMGDGVVSPYALSTGRRDFEADIPIEEAWTRVGEVVSDFLAVHLDKDGAEGQLFRPEQAARRLQQKFQMTKNYFEAYRDIRSRRHLNEFIAEVQRKILGVKNDQADGKFMPRVVTWWHNTKDDFIYSKPTIEPDGSLFVQGYEDRDMQIRTGPAAQIVATCALKFKSREAILEHEAYASTKADSKETSQSSLSAAQINEETFEAVLRNVTSEQRERFLKEGTKLRFLPDRTEWKEGPDWVNAPLEVTRDSSDPKVMNVRSPTIRTAVDLKPARFAGMTYMKLLMPAQAYEWIVFDAFK